MHSASAGVERSCVKGAVHLHVAVAVKVHDYDYDHVHAHDHDVCLELHWQLSPMMHPEWLRRRFSIAAVFTMPGIRWQELDAYCTAAGLRMTRIPSI
jgi:hypothetical protein